MKDALHSHIQSLRKTIRECEDEIKTGQGACTHREWMIGFAPGQSGPHRICQRCLVNLDGITIDEAKAFLEEWNWELRELSQL